MASKHFLIWEAFFLSENDFWPVFVVFEELFLWMKNENQNHDET